MKKSETILQEKIKKVLSKYGRVFRMNSGVFRTADNRFLRCGIKGMSDLLFVGKGYIAWLECKTETGKPSPEQIEFIEDMRSLGHTAEIVRSVDDALKAIKNKGEFAMIETDYKNLNDDLIPEGKYEVVIKSAGFGATPWGTEYIDLPLVVRNDVEQSYQNKYIFYKLWKKNEPDERDKECNNFSAKQIFKLCQAVGIPENKKFENLEEIFAELSHKPIFVGIKHDVYNDKKQAKISFTTATKFPECKHEFKKDDVKKGNKSIEITFDEEDIPF